MLWTVSIQNAPQVGGATYTLGADAEIDQLSWSTNIVGGFNLAKVGLRSLAQPQYGYAPRQYDIKLGGHLEIRDGAAGRIVYAGRITKLLKAAAGHPSGSILGLEATGYGICALDDNFYVSSDVSASTSGQVLQDVLATTTPLLKPALHSTLWQDPGISMTHASVTQTQTSQIVQQVTQAGGSAIPNIYDFQVWENFAAYLRPRVLQTGQPDYEIPIDDGITDWQEDFTLACSNVVARYTPSGGSATLTSPTTFAQALFLNTYGFLRTSLIDCGTTTAAFAAGVATAYQALHAGPEISIEVTRGTVRHAGGEASIRDMEQPGGGSRPAAQVRAGEWVRVGDDGVAGNPPPLIVIETEYNANSNELKAKLGYQPKTFWPLINRALNTVRAVQHAASPISGARIAAG